MRGVAVRQACRRLAIVCLAAILLYIAVAAVASMFPDVEQVEGARFWPAFLPDWPIAMLLTLAALFVVCDVLLWVLGLASTRREREHLEKLAAGWAQRADAKMAAASGDQELRLGAFRAQAQPGGAVLRWTAPASTFDRIVVLRSRSAFALAAVAGMSQAVAYEGAESGFVDAGLEPDRVYFYTAFAEARGAGQWSPPAWAAVTTPPERLRDVALGRIWTLRR